eukprot:m.1055550 g.1055550  ORF g.1055550 m.1055550 type:complete len:56 (+) comp24192_c1_seq40:660-827(+)
MVSQLSCSSSDVFVFYITFEVAAERVCSSKGASICDSLNDGGLSRYRPQRRSRYT